MASWPIDYSGAWTLAQAVERSGVGLHSGATGRVRLQASERSGYWVGRLDQPQQPLQRLAPCQVFDTQLCTCLALDSGRLATVEHLLAALAGVGVSQAEIFDVGRCCHWCGCTAVQIDTTGLEIETATTIPGS